jgi:hypothetical protein
VTRHLYSGFGFSIESELELPELPSGNGPPDVVIRLGTVPHNRLKVTREQEFSFNTMAGAFRIAGGREIVVDPLAGAEPEAVRLILLGRIMAFLLGQRGWLPLHASVVLLRQANDGHKAVLFLAASGEGKSTTAAAFHAQGHAVVSDDVGAVRVVNGQCMVRAAWPRLRLFEDSSILLDGMNLPSTFQVDKHRYDLGGGQPPGVSPVARIYDLRVGPGVRTEAIPPLEAVPLLSRHSFTRHPKLAPEALAEHLRDCASVASSTPLFRLERPRVFEVLPALVRMIEEDLA